MEIKVLTLRQVSKCPFLILVPEHFRADGMCRCDDPEHRKKMKDEWGYTDAQFRAAGLLDDE